MDPIPLCAWCGLSASDIPDAKFARKVVQSADGRHRISYGLHYRDGGVLSCDGEEPYAAELRAGRVPGEILQAISDRGAGRVLIRPAKAAARRMRPVRAAHPRA